MNYLVEKVVTDLINDEVSYPQSSESFNQGFQNIERVEKNGEIYEGVTKFCKLFGSKFNRTNRLVFTANSTCRGVTDFDPYYVSVPGFGFHKPPKSYQFRAGEYYWLELLVTEQSKIKVVFTPGDGVTLVKSELNFKAYRNTIPKGWDECASIVLLDSMSIDTDAKIL